MTTTDDYIATFPDEVRPILTEVAEALRRALPGAEERIRYGMPAFLLGDRYALHFAGWKHHVSVYPIPDGDAALDSELAPYKAARGTLQFPLDKPMPLELIGRVATRRLQQEREQASA